jgi:agmatine deiminase
VPALSGESAARPLQRPASDGKSRHGGIECAAMSASVTARRLPAEWEPQAGVMLTWPHRQGDWADVLEEVEPVFLAIAAAIARRENLLINCIDREQAGRLRQRLADDGVDQSRLFFHLTPSDDTWARDHGPLTVMENGQPLLLDFRFNGWGNKYAAAADDAINAGLAGAGFFGPHPMQRSALVLEGGSIDSDGQGTLLTTSSCLLNPQRNPALSRRDIESQLLVLLGAERLLWLEQGCIEGDDTDGHIDMLARFADAHTIVYQSCDDVTYSCYASLKAMEAALQDFRDRDGRPYRLVPLPWPEAKTAPGGERMPASYANFLLINGAVLLPVYRDPADRIAVQQLQRCFPGRDIVALDCLPLIAQHGSLHCLTMQFPAAVGFRRVDKPY